MRSLRNIVMTEFKEDATPCTLFNHAPRLSIHDAFNMVSVALPPEATVLFSAWKGQKRISIYPYADREHVIRQSGSEPTCLSCHFLPELNALKINRIHVYEGHPGESRHHGTGSAMIASQYPFWRFMGVKALALSAHAMSEGFYRKLGFERVSVLPEAPRLNGKMFTLMRLDLENPAQKEILFKAMDKAPSLSAQPLPL